MHRVHVARSLATAAAEAEGSASAPAAAPPINRARAGHRKRGNAIIHTAVIVNRSPILTRTPTPFERAYYAYQARIERALHNPLPTEFYFKPGSLLEGIFTREESARERKAFGGPRVLNINKKPDDEGEDEAKGPHTLLPGEEPAPKLMSRISKADRTGDVKSLDRKGERNMYLLIQGKDETGKEVWRFPQSELGPEEMLHQVCSTLHPRSLLTSLLSLGCPASAKGANWNGHLAGCPQANRRTPPNSLQLCSHPAKRCAATGTLSYNSDRGTKYSHITSEIPVFLQSAHSGGASTARRPVYLGFRMAHEGRDRTPR